MNLKQKFMEIEPSKLSDKFVTWTIGVILIAGTVQGSAWLIVFINNRLPILFGSALFVPAGKRINWEKAYPYVIVASLLGLYAMNQCNEPKNTIRRYMDRPIMSVISPSDSSADTLKVYEK